MNHMPKHETSSAELMRTWSLTTAATLGSSVRAKGILLELRARLPVSSRKSLVLEGGEIMLAMPPSEKAEFRTAAAIVSETMRDILVIKPGERHRWVSDGRLPSAGTRTVRLAGRAKQITFHVFDPRIVEDILDRGLVDEWREEDIATAMENRRKAAYKAKLTRTLKKGSKANSTSRWKPDDDAAQLNDWEKFDRDGLLR